MSYEMEAETLAGDVRDVMLTHLRSMMVGWSYLSEKEQRERIAAIDKGARELVRQALLVITNFDHPHIGVDVGKVDFEKELTIKLTAPRYVESTTALAEHGKAAAVLVLADPQVFMGERGEPEVDKDEPTFDDYENRAGDDDAQA